MAVKSTDEMTDEEFKKHFEFRHMPMGNLTRLVGYSLGERAMRAYHERCHRLGSDDTGRDTARLVSHVHRDEIGDTD